MRYAEFAKDPEATIDNLNTVGEVVVITNLGRFAFLIEALDISPPELNTEPSR